LERAAEGFPLKRLTAKIAKNAKPQYRYGAANH
jgi:hypothetical protein